MLMKLSVGLTRKVGQPDRGSLGASCAVELNVDPEGDPTEFHSRARAAYAACARAVRDELERHRAAGPGESSKSRVRRDQGTGPDRGPATAAQARALGRLATRRGLDLDAVLGARFGVDGPEGLSVAEAGRLIEELQEAQAATA